MREDLRHYIDVSMGEDEFCLLGDGIEALTEEMNPEEETKHYINMTKAANSVKSYQRSFEVDKEDCAEDKVQKWIDGLVDRLPVGTSAKTSFIRFRLKDAVASQTGVYKALKVPCTVSVSSTGGNGGDYVHNVINVKQCGDDEEGTFDIVSEQFTKKSND